MLDALKKRLAKLEGERPAARHLTHEEWIDQLELEDHAALQLARDRGLVERYGSLEAAETAMRAEAERTGDTYYRQLDELACEIPADMAPMRH